MKNPLSHLINTWQNCLFTLKFVCLSNKTLNLYKTKEFYIHIWLASNNLKYHKQSAVFPVTLSSSPLCDSRLIFKRLSFYRGNSAPQNYLFSSYLILKKLITHLCSYKIMVVNQKVVNDLLDGSWTHKSYQ